MGGPFLPQRILDMIDGLLACRAGEDLIQVGMLAVDQDNPVDGIHRLDGVGGVLERDQDGARTQVGKEVTCAGHAPRPPSSPWRWPCSQTSPRCWTSCP